MPDEGRRHRERQEKFDAVDRADHLARFGALDEQVGGHDRPPAAAARRIEEAPDEAERCDHRRLADFRRIEQPADQQPHPDGDEIGQDDRFDDRTVDRRQQIGAGQPADQARDEQTEEEAPFDIAVKQMADPRHRGREHLDDMDARRCRRGRHAHHGDEQGVADHPERHAERAVDELRGEADQDEGQQRRKIEG